MQQVHHPKSVSQPKLISVTTALTVVMAVSGCSTIGNMMGSESKPKEPFAIGEKYQAPKQPVAAQRDLIFAEVSQANVKLASAYFSAGQYKTAEEVIAKSLATAPNDAEVLGLAALIQAELRNKTKAQEYFDRAFKADPKNADLNHNYGVHLCRNNDPVRALEHFKAALQVEAYDKSSGTLSAAADCLVKLGRDDEALQYYTAALRFEPGNASALIGMADLQYRRGSSREAHEIMARYVRVAVASPDSLWLQLRIARKLGLKQDERSHAADLRKTFPSSTPTKLLDEGKFD